MRSTASPEPLDTIVRVTDARGWIALLGACIVIAGTLLWCAFGTIAIRVSATGWIDVPAATHDAPTQATLYVSAPRGERVRAGMAVELSPDGFPAEEYGYVVAAVSNVVQPARLRGSAPALEVHADLSRDARSASGVRWSSGSGPGVALLPGTRCTASIILAYVHPIALLRWR